MCFYVLQSSDVKYNNKKKNVTLLDYVLIGSLVAFYDSRYPLCTTPQRSAPHQALTS